MKVVYPTCCGSAAAITDYLTSNGDFSVEHCVSLLHRSLRKKADDVLASIEDFEISPEQRYRISIVRDHLHYIEELIERADICINTMVEKYDGLFRSFVPFLVLTTAPQSR